MCGYYLVAFINKNRHLLDFSEKLYYLCGTNNRFIKSHCDFGSKLTYNLFYSLRDEQKTADSNVKIETESEGVRVQSEGT